jgi:hypothetical protein
VLGLPRKLFLHRQEGVTFQFDRIAQEALVLGRQIPEGRSNDEPAQWAERGAIRSHWHTGQVESAASAERGPEVRFAALPGRLFLDSSTLQTLLDYGGTVFEGERPPPWSRAYRIAGYLDDLDALRLTFLSERACGL